MKSTTAKIIVKYWRGTARFVGAATTYHGAMRIASQNQNAYGPTFWTESGEQLFDDGNGLATEKDMENRRYSF